MRMAGKARWRRQRRDAFSGGGGSGRSRVAYRVLPGADRGGPAMSKRSIAERVDGERDSKSEHFRNGYDSCFSGLAERFQRFRVAVNKCHLFSTGPLFQLTLPFYGSIGSHRSFNENKDKFFQLSRLSGSTAFGVPLDSAGNVASMPDIEHLVTHQQDINPVKPFDRLRALLRHLRVAPSTRFTLSGISISIRLAGLP